MVLLRGQSHPQPAGSNTCRAAPACRARIAQGCASSGEYARLADAAVRETIEQLEATGSTVITDGEQSKPSFATYPLAGLAGLAPDGV